MTHEGRHAVWRVRAHDGGDRERGFDALVLVDGAEGADRARRLVGLPLPYEGEMPDRPLTLIAAAHPGVGSLVVEYRGCRPDGTECVAGRSTGPVAIVVRSATGILTTGLGREPPELPVPPT
jgi:hypothetical protein